MVLTTALLAGEIFFSATSAMARKVTIAMQFTNGRQFAAAFALRSTFPEPSVLACRQPGHFQRHGPASCMKHQKPGAGCVPADFVVLPVGGRTDC